ncbi:PucR family transcriptional regulator [Saccharothrix syringae]|uniref:PucR family transcriptional regulator n=1 Tax=Saccharothrix syringae TaxID=103733 RepID=A0A5Q0H6E0_SACSY|nr:helix-turn-helix domain-containing protein [Saccharothrix syringae]QFZ21504.1 PucR family transcriptional regulator [Saccharothrix syringae]
MGDLFDALRRRAGENGERVVELCTAELPEYDATARTAADRDRMVEFAVHIRRRTLDCVAVDEPLTPDDLALVTAMGADRGRRGLSRAVHDQVLALHATATLREIHEACSPHDLDDAMHMLAWLAAHSPAAQRAYTAGLLSGQQDLISAAERVRRYADLLVAGDPVAGDHARSIDLPVPERYLVVVVRVHPQPDHDLGDPAADEVLDALWRHHRAPATWPTAAELVAFLPAGRDELAPALARSVAEITGRECAAGSATGPAGAIDEAVALARRVSRVVRPRTAPDHVPTLGDVAVEVGVAELPDVDRWLRGIAAHLAGGPELVVTLDSYYRNDMSRARTAASLNVHPRTLDYRLRRVHELVGIDPHSTAGIRVLGTAVSRFLADAPGGYRRDS